MNAIANPAPRLPRLLLAEIAPVMRRAVTLAPTAMVRIRLSGGIVTAFARLPFGVLVSRSITVSMPSVATSPVASDPVARGGVALDTLATGGAEMVDVTYRASEALQWFDGERESEPVDYSILWRGGLPPPTGWHRVEVVPDQQIRALVRAGALAIKAAAVREGVPGAQPRAGTADALLDSVVLTATEDGGNTRAEITLRTVSALTRMGFLKRDSRAAIDVAGRWTRVAARYGSVYSEASTPLVAAPR